MLSCNINSMRGCCWGANRAVQSHCYDSTHPQGLHYTLPITYTAPWRHAAQVLLNGALEIKFKQMLVMNYSKCVCVCGVLGQVVAVIDMKRPF